MNTTTDTNAALRTISGRLGQSIDLLRRNYGAEGMDDADLIETIRERYALGHIYVHESDAHREPISGSEREWLSTHLFRVTATGDLWRGEGRVVLPLPDKDGTIPGILAYDEQVMWRGSNLSSADQLAAIADWIRPAATWPVTQYDVPASGMAE